MVPSKTLATRACLLERVPIGCETNWRYLGSCSNHVTFCAGGNAFPLSNGPIANVSIADLAATCFAVQLLVGAILVIGEATGRLRLPYGKFRTGVGINSRAGLALAYAIPVFVYIALWVEGGSPRTLYHLAVFGSFQVHFVRRIFEVSFVNSYSRPTPLRAVVIIAFLYGGVGCILRVLPGPNFWPAHFSTDLHPRRSDLCLRRGFERIPSLAFGSSPPTGRAHLCGAAPWLVWLGGLSPLLGGNFEFCGICNDV